MTPTFSIIIPVYNVAPYLRECLDSVLAAARTLSEKCEARSEKCGAVEVICVNDGSTDGSGAILDEYAAKDKRFHVIHQANAGVSAARNAGLDVATGEWLCFIDSDDIVAPDWLTRWSEIIVTHPDVDAIRGEYVRFAEKAEPKFQRSQINQEIVADPTSRENIGRMLDYHYLFNCMYAFRRDAVADVRFPDFICGEDRLFTFSCLRHVKKLLLTDFVFYGYRTRSASYSGSGIRTFKGWLDELRYRIYFLDCVNELSFVPDLSNAFWLTPFLRREFIPELRTYHGEQFKSLWRTYREALPRLRSYAFLSQRDRRFYAFIDKLAWYPFVRMFFITCDDVRYYMPKCIRSAYRRLMGHGEFANHGR